MSQLFALSVDCLASPSVRLIPNPKISQHEKLYGWGFGWYPDDEFAATIIKDATSPVENPLTERLQDWKRFRSTIFVCHLRGSAKSISQPNTQPFRRSFAGRDWIWAHNGDVDIHKVKKTLSPLSIAFEPIGKTDSEWIFCWLLSSIADMKMRRIADISPEKLHEFFTLFDSFGTANFILSDGQTMVIYNDEDKSNPLYWKRCCPPHKDKVIELSTVNLKLDNALDTNRTMLVVSSGPGNGSEWQMMKPGQMIMVRRGTIIWNNFPDVATNSKVDSISVSPVNKNNDIVVGSQMPITPQNQQQNTRKISRLVSPATEERVFSVIHETCYEYDKNIDYSTHTFRLQPTHDMMQEILEYKLDISCEGEKTFFTDVFGNNSLHMVIDKPYNKMHIKSHSTVKVIVMPKDDFASEVRRASIPLVWMPWQRQMMLPYLLPPELPETQLRELSDFAMSFVERNDFNLFDSLRDINQTIYRDFSYVSGSTTLETTPFQVFSKRQGVCQDFANLMICLARLLNVPSRYQVGYIYTAKDYENKAQSDASHAWVELYLPYIGWRGFDPTNGCMVGRDHIRVACGRNYRDATPTSGTIFKGGGAEKLNVIVQVKEISTTNK